jgi:hypothetical protein
MRRAIAVALAVLYWTMTASAQALSERGFIEGRGFLFPRTTPVDDTRQIGDVLVREEVFLKPASWIQFAGGVDARTSSHHGVDRTWRLDWRDRGILRPRLSLRRLTATITVSRFSVDIGKQFIRWGRADVTYPTDRFAPRDYLNVVDPELLPVTGVRPSVQIGNETLEAVWLPHLTPSRLPRFDQRWTIIPAGAAALRIIDRGSQIGTDPQYGARWRHTGGHLESAVSYFEGSNHLPDVHAIPVPDAPAIGIRRIYPRIRMYGADAAIPTNVLTFKLEAAYVTSPSRATEEYVLYVIEAERQTGEWLLDAGYAGDIITRTSATSGRPFAPDRGLARSLIARAAYTIDPRRSLTIEGALRQTGRGLYLKGEYSSAVGQHWRLTGSAVGIRGRQSDFLGQYQANSYASVALRFSF